MDHIIYRGGKEQVGAVVNENGTLAPLYESQPYPMVGFDEWDWLVTIL